MSRQLCTFCRRPAEECEAHSVRFSELARNKRKNQPGLECGGQSSCRAQASLAYVECLHREADPRSKSLEGSLEGRDFGPLTITNAGHQYTLRRWDPAKWPRSWMNSSPRRFVGGDPQAINFPLQPPEFNVETDILAVPRTYIRIYVPVSLSEGGPPAIWLVTLYNTRNIP